MGGMRWLIRSLRYSWILLVVVLVFVLFVYLDVISFDTSSCTLSQDVKCLYFDYEGGQLTLELENTFDHALLGVDISVEGCTEPLHGTSISAEATETFAFYSCEFDEQFTAALTFTYVDSLGELHALEGEIVERTNLFKITT